jgi:acyl-CoA synthetase (NDP forming)
MSTNVTKKPPPSTAHEAKMRAIDFIFNARSVALVGASADPSKFGFMTLKSIIEGGYQGRIYPINPKGGDILGLTSYTNLDELPETPDLVVVIIPAKFVSKVLSQAGRLGIPAGMVLTAGFRESGRSDLEAELAAVPNRYGIHFAGPNIQGINYPANKLCTMFFPVLKTLGPLGVVSQSGTITTALSEWADEEGLGFSAAVNLGNQTDLCELDFLEYLADDRATGAIALYIEGLKNGRRFIPMLKKITAKKPVTILKGGRSEAGQRSVASHTGTLAGDHAIFSAACRQAGAVPATDLEHLYDAAKALATLHPPRGGQVLVFSTSGGAGTLAGDESERQGLTLPPLSSAFTETLAELELPSLAHPGNPFDLASLSPKTFEQVITLADRLEQADMFLVCFGDPVPGGGAMIADLHRRLKRPLAVTYFGGGAEEKKGKVVMHEAGVPVFATPERAMRALGALRWRTEYIKRRQENEIA